MAPKGKGLGKGGKGLGGAMRHRKVLRDNIMGLKKPQIRRLAVRSTIPQVNERIYVETRTISNLFLEDLMKSAITFTQHARRRTVSFEDVSFAYYTEFHRLFIGGPNGFDTKQLAEHSDKGKKKATKAVSDMRAYQKVDAHIFSKAAIERLVREIGQGLTDDMRYTKESFGLVQFLLEKYLETVFSNAAIVMFAADRKTLMPKDIQAARRIMGNY